MATSPTITGAVRGIDISLDGYVIRNVSFDRDHRKHRVPTQKDKTGYEETVERTYKVSFSVISDGSSTSAPPLEQDDFIIFPESNAPGAADKRWVVDNCKEEDTYNDDTKWSVTAHRYDDWPPQDPNWSPTAQPSGETAQTGDSSAGTGN